MSDADTHYLAKRAREFAGFYGERVAPPNLSPTGREELRRLLLSLADALEKRAPQTRTVADRASQTTSVVTPWLRTPPDPDEGASKR